ncbi:MAG: hypothetical protein H6508_02000 [Calditrichaeota bacterium]|nr:hypothetical protein [Calditrichota bacterium]
MFVTSKSATLTIALLLLALAPVAKAWEGATGVSWGYTRTYWQGTWYQDGYAEAGTAGNMLSVRHEVPFGAHTNFVMSGSYSWLRHTTTTLLEPVVIDPLTDDVISGGAMLTRTDHTYFREIDLAAQVHYYLDDRGASKFYVGGGPAARWGSAGKRRQDALKSDYHTQAAWFGLSGLAGIRQEWNDNGLQTFFEPQLLWSPDNADRYQETFPPVSLIVAMGILW